ncbi:MAG: TIGR00730 family Rossman fold protein [Prevotellaceae bacterium]|jgi:uncharacterized protein (TIGR00730 family)|nr:TIGR00730 family Rossman fold protein [Prevotellaceae bacterium]
MKICVFCASSGKIAPVFFEAAETLAREATLAGHTIICGGGSVGLMGKLADTVRIYGGRIVGVMPHFMRQVEWQHEGLDELILVDTMHQRKALLIEQTDAIVALPGGCGTLEELMEVITLKRLGLFTKPIIIVNTAGFYNHLLALFDEMIAQRFLNPEHRKAWTTVERPEDLWQAIAQSAPWSADAIRFATV